MAQASGMVRNPAGYEITKRLNPLVAHARTEHFAGILQYADDPEYINLAPAQHYHPPAQHVVEALHQATDDGRFAYGRTAGELVLVEAIARHMASVGLSVDPLTNVWVTHGAGHGFLLSLQTFLQPGDEVLTVDPSFPLNWYTAELFGARGIGIPVEPPEQIPERMAAAVTDRTKAVVLHPVNNPSGHVFSRTVVDGIAELAVANNLLVLSDEVYSSFTYDGSEPQHIADRDGLWDRTLTVDSVSKGHNLPGLRVGWIVGPERLLEAVSRIVRNGPVGASVIPQHGAASALLGRQDQLRNVVDEFASTRLMVAKRLDSIPGVRCHVPQGGFFIFADIRDLGKNVDELCVQIARDAKVGVAPGTWYGNQGRGHLRICYGAVPPGRLDDGLTRLESVLRQ